MTYKMIYEPAPQQKDIEILTNGIALNAKKKRGLDPLIPFAFFIRDDSNEINYKAGMILS